MSARATVELQAVSKVIAGGKSGQTGNDFVDGGYPAYGAGGLNGYLDGFEYDGDAVILSSIGARCGKAFYPQGKWSSLANTQLIFPNPNRVDRRFLWYQINDEDRWHRSGTAQPYIKPSDIKTSRVFLPPLPEQRRIAAILDQADELRTKRRRTLTLLDELADSLFVAAFPLWAGRPPSGLPTLGEFASQITDGEHQTPLRASAGYKLLSARNIQNGHLDFRLVDFVGHEEYNRISKRCRPQRGDVLVSCSGSIGRVTSVKTDEEFVLVRSVALIRPGPELDPLFLERYLRTSQMQREMTMRSKASAQANLFQAQIRSLPVIVPPQSEQRRFRRETEELNRLVDIQKDLILHDDELFASLRHRAFRGEL